MSPTFIKGVVFGVLLVALWLHRQRQMKLSSMFLLGIYYLITVRLMQMVGCFHS